MGTDFPIPANEEERLEVLRKFRILDTAPEPLYDDIAKLVAFVCDVPIALISFIDAERQWFKASLGLSARETPRDQAFCAHAILGSDTMVVEDATRDARFADNPLVTGSPDIRFYAGAPLTTSDGVSIGTLCAIDRKPRQLSAEQQQNLESLRNVVLDLLSHRRVSHTLAEALEHVHTLHGLLPICSHCMAIRDEAGSWQTIHNYIRQNTEAEFTHTICPVCMQAHYAKYVRLK